jgi:hypothetical protein
MVAGQTQAFGEVRPQRVGGLVRIAPDQLEGVPDGVERGGRGAVRVLVRAQPDGPGDGRRGELARCGSAKGGPQGRGGHASAQELREAAAGE